MCGTTEILNKFVCNPGKNLTKRAQSPGPLKILEKKTHKMSPIPGTPENPWRSCGKPHKKKPIPGASGDLGKNLTK